MSFDEWVELHGIEDLPYLEFRNPSGRVPYFFLYLNDRAPNAVGADVPTMVVDASGVTPNSFLTLQSAWDAADDGAIIAVLPSEAGYDGFEAFEEGKAVLFLGVCVDGEIPRIVSTVSVSDTEEGVVMFDGFIFQAQDGEAVVAEAADVWMVNCLFRSDSEGATILLSDDSSAGLVHCTMVQKLPSTADRSAAVSVYVDATSEVFIKNAILHDVAALQEIYAEQGADVVIEDSIMRGFGGNLFEGNIMTRDGWLFAESVARCAAEPGWTAADIRQQPRPAQTKLLTPPDIGCDEFTSSDGIIPDWFALKYLGGTGTGKGRAYLEAYLKGLFTMDYKELPPNDTAITITLTTPTNATKL